MIPLSDTKTSNHRSTINKLLIALNCVIFVIELTAVNTEAFISQYSFIPAAFQPFELGSYVPIITSMFLHGGVFHLFSNMIFLWVFGDNIEHRLGALFLPFYLGGGIAAAVTQYVVNPTSNIPTIGASGAVAAVLGAYLVWYPNHKVNTLIPVLGFPAIIEIPAPFLLLYWFVTQLFSGIAAFSQEVTGGIAWFAHIGGFVYGWLVAQGFKVNSDRNI
jgi:membrane associated rhomboid family serine protease